MFLFCLVQQKQLQLVSLAQFPENQYIFSNSVINKNGTLQTSSWIPVNEANPLSEMVAQKTIIEELEFELLEKLIEEYWLIES